MNTVILDPSSISCYQLKPLEALSRVLKAPDFFCKPNDAFAQYIMDKTTRASAANTSICAESTLMLSQAHMGVALFSQQKDTSRLLAGFVYKLMVPDSAVPTETRFCKRYRITDQREAHEGTYDTVGNGVQTKEYSQVFHLTSKVVTMQFGSLLKLTVPSVAKDLIMRELESVSTSWELTRTLEVLRYCAAQPTLTDRVAQRSKTFTRAEKLDSILIMAELMCGMINIQPASFICALENARRILRSDKPEVVILGDTLFRVISQRSTKGTTWTHIVTEQSKVTPEFVVYTTTNETERLGGCHEFTMREVTHRDLADRDLPRTKESCFQENAIEMQVKYISLGGGSVPKIPIVHVDAVQMEHSSQRDTSTEHKAFCNPEGFKWEYFTVGCMAPALNQLNPSHVLSAADSDEINCKQLAQRSPCVSFIHQYDGSVVRVALCDLHPLANTRELFTRERRAKLQNDVDALMRGENNTITAEKLAQLGRQGDWYNKIRNPASVLEFDARNMVVPHRQSEENVTPQRWIVRPRVALFNSSPMNNIDNEIAQIGSELLLHFGDTDRGKKLLEETLPFLEEALHYTQGVEFMVRLRQKVLENGSRDLLPDILEDKWSEGRKFWSLLTDPICAVTIRRVLAEKENSGLLEKEESVILLQLERMIDGFLGLFHDVVGDRRNSVLASMPAFFTNNDNGVTAEYGYPVMFTSAEVDYCNLMYWIILPVLGARVYRVENDKTPLTVRAELRYRDDEFNLSNELQMTGNNKLTVTRLHGNCFFSKKPINDMVDVTELFEPTATRHTACTDTGFSDTSVVTYVWAIRIQKLSTISNALAKVLLGMHYSTLMTRNVIINHYDKTYYSGMSYLLFRGVRFTGCGASLMQQKSALYTLGAKITCMPTAHNTHQVYTVNQCCQSVVIPETLESPGVYIPNLYMKDVRGGDVQLGTQGPFDMVIVDAFNGFCPESDSASGYRRPYIFTTGRSERLNGHITQDPLMRAEAYTCMPTLLRPFSSTLVLKSDKRYLHRSSERSNHKIFCDDILHMVEFKKGVLDPIGDPFRDTVERVNGDKRATDLMQSSLGVAFCGTYSIGLTSDKKLMCSSDETRETLVDRLAPRISGTGIFAGSPVHVTSRIINPVFNRIFESTRYSRILRC